MFIKGLNTDLWVLFAHKTFVGKSFNNVVDCVNKLEEVKQVAWLRY